MTYILHVLHTLQVSVCQFNSSLSLDHITSLYARLYHKHILRLYEVLHRDDDTWLVYELTASTLHDTYKNGYR